MMFVKSSDMVGERAHCQCSTNTDWWRTWCGLTDVMHLLLVVLTLTWRLCMYEHPSWWASPGECRFVLLLTLLLSLGYETSFVGAQAQISPVKHSQHISRLWQKDKSHTEKWQNPLLGACYDLSAPGLSYCELQSFGSEAGASCRQHLCNTVTSAPSLCGSGMVQALLQSCSGPCVLCKGLAKECVLKQVFHQIDLGSTRAHM